MEMPPESNDLLIALWELSERIRSHGGVLPGESMVERYKFFVEHSEAGTNCHLARKCRDLFVRYDYDDIKKQILSIVELYGKIGI